MAGKIYNIENLSYPRIEELDREKTALVIAISPLEEHGPHLPVGVDSFNALFFARRTAEIILENHPEYDVLLFPLLPVGTQVYRHIGSFYVKPGTVYDVIYNTGRSLAIYGFANIFVLTAHGTPRQIVAIEKACGRVSAKLGVRMHCLTGALAFKFLNGKMYESIAKNLGREFTAEEKKLLQYDYHAGWWETSMALKLYPELVSGSYENLKPYLAAKGAPQKLTGKKESSGQQQWQGYIGAPDKADIAFAEASIEVFSRLAADLVERCLRGEDISRDALSPFYKNPMFHPFFKRNIALGVAIVVFLVMILLLLKAYLF